jgi:hypothetical protein
LLMLLLLLLALARVCSGAGLAARHQKNGL